VIDRKQLLDDLQKLLPKVEADLLERSESAEVPDVGRTLREEYAAAQAAERTAQSFEEWRSDAITQTAAAWVLSCVFVRFLEDNGLVETPKVAGPGERLKRARDEHEIYFRSHPTLTDRDYLLAVFDGLMKFPATKDVFGEHNPIRDIPNWLSGDAAGELLRFFQRIDPNTGALVHDFTDPSWDTRFLGDLYQDLSEEARKRYALLQTPIFVEEFILDRTLDPAIEEFGLAGLGYESRLEPDSRLHPDDRFRMIDPACGSGHFLLGSFTRLVERWRKKEPGMRVSVLVQRALDSVHGVDLNPYAIAIARFRLLLSALKESGVRRLSDAPAFEIHLACGDSLLHGSPGGDQLSMGWSSIDHVYQPEDRYALSRLLRPRFYQAVVANPPYNAPRDAALNEAYRERFATCHMKYTLSVPFLERVVSLAVSGGFTGQITANSFMKREFGKKLIEGFISSIDVTHVVDCSGLSFGTRRFGGVPTVIIFARSRRPVGNEIRAVMGKRGEPSTPEDPSQGLVWTAIATQIDLAGSESEFVSVGDLPRAMFQRHPWSIGGGGATQLKKKLEDACSYTLGDVADEGGVLGMTNADEVMLAPAPAFRRRCVEPSAFKLLVAGDNLHDWRISEGEASLFPYSEHGLTDLHECPGMGRWLWPCRTVMGNRATFSKLTYFAEGRPWWGWHQITLRRLRTPFSIVFPELATHNHFVLDRGGRLFKQTTPLIKLPSGSTEEQHIGLVGLLNSSVACFWIKQVFQNKGSSVDQHGTRQTSVAFENFWQLDSTKLRGFPVPPARPLALAKRLASLGEIVEKNHPSGVANKEGLSRQLFDEAEKRTQEVESEMIALQEELDWETYSLYGLTDEEFVTKSPPPLRLGQRAFEVVLARKMAKGEIRTTWFERHGSIPITELPTNWPDEYRQLVIRRIALIKSDPDIALIEQPEYKRRWNTEPWESQLERALREWLLDRLESYFDFDGRMNDEGKPTARVGIALTSVARLADVARQDPEFQQVGELYRDDPAFDVGRLVAELVEAESVPLLPVLRYKPPGLRKREEWEKTWALQRLEDAIDDRTKLPAGHADYLSESAAEALKKKQVGTIPVPPKYTSADVLKSDYWRLRGKLDVRKERWVSFPYCEGPDGTLVIAWAGYDHLQLARAISAYFVDVQERLGGRDDPRLVPLLACLIELLPWLKQWHNEVDPEFGVPMGDYFEGFLQEESRNLSLTLGEIKSWQPPQRVGGRSRGRRKG
jgi:hypothetical protein